MVGSLLLALPVRILTVVFSPTSTLHFYLYFTVLISPFRYMIISFTERGNSRYIDEWQTNKNTAFPPVFPIVWQSKTPIMFVPSMRISGYPGLRSGRDWRMGFHSRLASDWIEANTWLQDSLPIGWLASNEVARGKDSANATAPLQSSGKEGLVGILLSLLF